VVTYSTLAKPVRGFGYFVAWSLDVLVQVVRPPVAWREFIHQCWFAARVSTLPAIGLSTAFDVVGIFLINILLIEIGAGDLSGTAAAIAVITQTGPFCTALVCSGAAATAMCADLGARTIREELDAMRVMGINPVQRLAAPRVAALTVVAFLLCGLVCVIGFVGSYFFAIYVQNLTPGAFAASLTFIVGLRDTIVCFTKAVLFGLVGGLIACYKGFNPAPGPAGVGNAVNETVVYTLMAMIVVNSAMTAFGTVGVK
jgi:phospholipid/cholesterol/gamma-HCH transport system permease protein